MAQIEELSVRKGDQGLILADLKPEGNAEIRAQVFTAFAEAKIPLLEMKSVRASLEDVFLELTQGDVQVPAAGKETEAPDHPSGSEGTEEKEATEE